MTIGKKDVVKPKIFTIRQEADSEVAIHAIKEIVDDSKTETVLLSMQKMHLILSIEKYHFIILNLHLFTTAMQ